MTTGMIEKSGTWMVLAMLALLVAPTPAQEEGGDAPSEAMIAAMTPGPNHETLARMAGDWVAVHNMFLAPGAPATVAMGTAKKEMILGGRYLKEHIFGEMMGTPWEGIAITGHDNVGKEFTGTWIDTMSTGVMVSGGQIDAGATTLALECDYDDPMSGQTKHVRIVLTIKGDDHHTMDYYSKPPEGDEAREVHVDYFREGSDLAKSAGKRRPAPDAAEAPAEAGGMDNAALAAFMAAMTPGDQHQYLARMAGDWDYVSKMWMAPDTPPMESTGTSAKAMIFGGRYLTEVFSGDWGGMPFTGNGLMAYDNHTGKLVSTWIDNFGTGTLVAKGQLDLAADEFETIGESRDPETGKPMRYRLVTKITDDDHHVFQYHITAEGQEEAKVMEIAFSRQEPSEEDGGAEDGSGK